MGDEQITVIRSKSVDVEMQDLYRLKNAGRLIILDHPITPRYRDWSQSHYMQRLIMRMNAEKPVYKSLLNRFALLAGYLTQIPLLEKFPDEPYWLNDWIPGLDGISLYCIVAQNNPPTYLEVGSGDSTKFVRKAIRDHNLQTRIVSIHPEPLADINDICDEVYRCALQDCDLAIFDKLTGSDVVFIDNSHQCFPNSDVTVFFMEVLGRLKRGTIYGLHDIFLPVDYPDEWAPRYYSEHYLLACYLFGGGNGDQILLPCSYVSRTLELTAALDKVWKDPEMMGIRAYGGAFWLRKTR